MKDESEDRQREVKMKGETTGRRKRKRQELIADVDPKLHRTETFLSAPACFRINIFTDEFFRMS